jgi:toxin CptA
MADRLMGICWTAGAGCASAAAIGLTLQGTTGWRAWTPCAAALLSGLSLWRSRRQSIPGELMFDGDDWSLTSTVGVVMATGRARIALDLQRLMLLRIEEDRRPGHWLWVDRDGDRSRWRDLRRVLCAGRHVTASAAQRRQDGRAVLP